MRDIAEDREENLRGLFPCEGDNQVNIKRRKNR